MPQQQLQAAAATAYCSSSRPSGRRSRGPQTPPEAYKWTVTQSAVGQKRSHRKDIKTKCSTERNNVKQRMNPATAKQHLREACFNASCSCLLRSCRNDQSLYLRSVNDSTAATMEKQQKDTHVIPVGAVCNVAANASNAAAAAGLACAAVGHI